MSICGIPAQKNSQGATIFACNSTGMPIFAEFVAFGNAGRTDARQRRFAVVHVEFARRPVGNAVLDGIAMSRHVPVIVLGHHFAPAPGLAQLQRGKY